MTNIKPSIPNSSITTYSVIAVLSFLAAIAIGYVYFNYIIKSSSSVLDDRIFYLVLILFGIAASALIFGLMNSYAELKGIQTGANYKFTGPIVGVIITVLGGFLLPEKGGNENLSIKILNESKIPISNGKVVVSFNNYSREELINSNGIVVFSDISKEKFKEKIAIDIQCDGYQRLRIDTLLTDSKVVSFVMNPSRIIKISGKVIDARETPIKDVELTIDGTAFTTNSINNGSFSLTLKDYHFGDKITLVTSHPKFEDKIKELTISSGEINDIEFVLQPSTESKN